MIKIGQVREYFEPTINGVPTDGHRQEENVHAIELINRRGGKTMNFVCPSCAAVIVQNRVRVGFCDHFPFDEPAPRTPPKIIKSR